MTYSAKDIYNHIKVNNIDIPKEILVLIMNPERFNEGIEALKIFLKEKTHKFDLKHASSPEEMSIFESYVVLERKVKQI